MTDVFDNEDLYNAILLGTARSPGFVELSGHDRAKNWDVKNAKGQTGSSTVLNGDPIGEFTATFHLIDDEDHERWPAFQFLLETMVGGPKPIALPVYHPDLAQNGFTEVTIKSIGGIVRDGVGGASVSVKFLEYKPPKPKPAKKADAKPAAGDGVRIGTTVVQKPDPNAAAKAELARLLEEARKP